MAIPQKQAPGLLTFDEYVSLEASSEVRHEFDRGRVLAMAGGTFAHSAIILNLGGELRQALKGKPCTVLESNMRVLCAQRVRAMYPDAQVVCGNPEFALKANGETDRTTILNPKVVVEVLSPSTAGYDRSGKFEAYRDLASLQEYILVETESHRVETFRRMEDGAWQVRFYDDLKGAVRVMSLGIEISMAEIYRGVTLDPSSAPEQETPSRN